MGKEASLLGAFCDCEARPYASYVLYIRAGLPHPEKISEIGTPDSC